MLADRARAAYLAGCAPKLPGQAAELLARMLGGGQGQQDPMVQLHAVRAALVVPPEHARRIAGQLRPRRRGHPLRYSVAVQEIADLAVRLAEPYPDDAARLAGVILSIEGGGQHAGADAMGTAVPGGAAPVVGGHYFDLVLREAVPRIADKAPVQIIGVLVRRLAKVVHDENEALPEGGRDSDASAYWRPAIEDHPNNPPSPWSELVGRLAKTLVQLGERSIPGLGKAMEEIAKRKYPVFRRIELHVYRRLPVTFADEICAAAVDCFGRMELTHEYYWLIRDRFRHLPEGVRRAYLERVLAGPGDVFTRHAKMLEQAGAGPPAEAAVRHWKARKLAPAAGQLDESERRLVGDELAREGREAACPDFVVRYGRPRVGVDDSQIRKGTGPDEVVDTARSYRGKAGSLGGMDGTPASLQECCESDPEVYSARAGELSDAHPYMRAALLKGIRTAVDKGKGKGKDVRWEEVLGLCRHTVRAVRDGRAAFDDEAGALDAIAALLRTALAEDLIGYSMRQEVWSLLADMSPLGEEGEEYDRAWEEEMAQAGGGNGIDGALTMALNTVGGMTFLAIAEYAAWCSRHAGRNARLAPEVKDVLARYMDGKIPNTPPRHAAVGHVLPFLYWCDKDWIRGRASGLFGGGGALARAAWNAYLANSPDRNSFGDMVGMYRAEVDSPRPPSEDGGGPGPYSEDLITHVTQGHLLRMGGDDAPFWDMAGRLDKGGRLHCAWIVHMVLKAHADSPCESFDRERFREVWASDLFAFNDFVAEWVNYSPLDPEETLGLLRRSLESAGGEPHPMFLARALARFAAGNPAETMDCLEAMAGSEALHGEFQVGGDDLRGALGTLVAGEATRARAVALINRLGEMGYNEYGELLGGEHGSGPKDDGKRQP